MDGTSSTEFPKIFSGRVTYGYTDTSQPGDPANWELNSRRATLQTWQTTHSITIGGSVWYGRITRPDFAMRFPSVAATSWVMGTVGSQIIADASLDSTLGTEGQIQVALTSAICRKADGYEYTYTLKNKTDETVSFNLAAASLDVKLKKGQIYVHSIQSDRPGQESRQVAMVSGKGIGFKNMKTNIIVPMVAQASKKVASADVKNVTCTDS